MPYCGNCGAPVNDSANFCPKCGTQRFSKMLQVASNYVPSEYDIAMLDQRLATDEAFRIEYVKNNTCRTNVTSDDMIVRMLANDPNFRRDFINGRVSDKYIDYTKCSELPLNWKSWPNFILIENAFPAEMADNIAAFIKRTKDDNSISNSHCIYLISMDPSRSWSSLQRADNVLFYDDNAEDGMGEFYLLYGLCREELDSLAKNRLSNIDEYNSYFPNKYYSRHLLFIDDYDMFVQRANDIRLQREILPFLVSYANRLGFYFIFGSRFGPRTLGNLRNYFSVKSPSDFSRMCKGEHSTNTIINTAVSGYDFEHYCANILIKKSFTNVEVTKKSGDQGIDILAEKDGVKYAIQCKYYTSAVGNNAVQEAFAGKAFYGCHIAVVMTNNSFTDSARQLASQLGVVLWDGSFISE